MTGIDMGDDQEDYKSDDECTEGQQEMDVQMLGQYSGQTNHIMLFILDSGVFQIIRHCEEKL